MKRQAIIALSMMIGGTSFASEDVVNSCVGLSDVLPCNLKTISWVEVRFQGDLLKDQKGSFEKLIRLRLRNDLSMYGQEVKKFDEVMKEVGFDIKKQEAKERGQVSCLVWTVGTDYPVAFFVECALSGYGYYSSRLFEKFESRILGYGSKQSIRNQVEESIRRLITDISADLLETRDTLKQLGEKLGKKKESNKEN